MPEGTRRDLLACSATHSFEKLGVGNVELVDLEEGEFVAEVAESFFGGEGADELALYYSADGRDAIREGDFWVGAAVGLVAQWLYPKVSTLARL